MEKKTSKQRLRKKLLLALAALALGLLVGEVGLRVADVSFPVFDTYDPERGVSLRPGKTGWYRREGNAFLTINQLGYRDVEHSLEKPEGVFRIAVLGDSFTEARQVELDDTYWKRLESLLNAEGELTDRIEVMNFGIGSYGTSQELLTLEKDALRFSPDLVLLAFFTGNDVPDNSSELTDNRFRPFHVLEEERLVLDDSFSELSLAHLRKRVLLTWVHYSRILEVANQFRRARRVAQIRKRQQDAGGGSNDRERAPVRAEQGLSNSVFTEPTSDVWKRAWSVTDALIERIEAESRSAGARFALVVVPAPVQVHPDPAGRERLARNLGVEDLSYCERRLTHLGERVGFTVIELSSRMEARARAEETYLHGFEQTALGTGHWNEQGHALVAEILLADLRQAGLLP